MAGTAVSLSNITRRFGLVEVLRGIDLDIEPGEFMTLVGPSGCGKSTLLRIIAGLEGQDEGSVSIGGQQIDHLRAKDRDVAMVFQSYALYPHMSVFENLATPLVMQRMSFAQRFPGLGKLLPGTRRIRQTIDADAIAVARQLHVNGLLDRKPGQLSGGQRQRVALGRAMVRHPSVFLMDEPLSNLDARLRVQMRAELAELHKRLGATFLYVTHDQVEAMTMSQRIAVMIDGQIIQLGAPAEIYDEPQDLRVAQFIGSPSINVLPASTDKSGSLILLGHALPIETRLPSEQGLQVGIRPEDVHIRRFQVNVVGGGAPAARIRHIENLGNEHVIYLDLDKNADLQIVARLPSRELAPVLEHGGANGAVRVELPPERIYLFDAKGVRIDLPAKKGVARSKLGG